MNKKEARRASRIVAVEALFAFLERGGSVTEKESVAHVISYVEEKENDDFAREIVSAAVENVAKLKIVIRAFAPDFPFNKIAPINRAILLLGLAEMKYLSTPPGVVINEYIELAKLFGEQKSAGFINAVLDSFRQNAKLKDSEKTED
jgi:N utilization substance protein B